VDENACLIVQTLVGWRLLFEKVNFRLRRKAGMTKFHNQAFGKILRELRKSKNLSQEAFAFDAGFDRTYILLLELGKKSPTLNTIVNICCTLDISLTQLAFRIEATVKENHELAVTSVDIAT
jgi:DNA-binding XRE family transcriptional regulator